MKSVFTAAFIIIILHWVCPALASDFDQGAGIIKLGLWQEDSNPAPTLGWEKWRDVEADDTTAAAARPAANEPLRLADTSLLMAIQTDGKGNNWASITNEQGAEIARINLSGVSDSYVICTYNVYMVLKEIGLSYDAFIDTVDTWEALERKRFRSIKYKDLFPKLPSTLTNHKRHFLRYASNFLKQIKQFGLPEESAASILLAYSSYLGRKLRIKPDCYSEKI